MNKPAYGLHLTHRHIVHPSDFSSWGRHAFRHALKLSLLVRAHFTLLHIDTDTTATGFEEFPRIRPLLTQWGLLPSDSPKERVEELGLYVRKIRAVATNEALAIVQHLSTHPADLVVLASHRREGLTRWLHRSVAEPVARGIHIPTLFVPGDQEGFVAEADGAIHLRRILLPAARSDTTQLAAEAIATLGTVLECDQLDIHLLHVDDDHATPTFRPPDHAGWSWQATRLRGDVTQTILSTAEELKPDLLVMTTEGHVSLVDTLRGSTTEQVLRQASCPVLVLPTA